MAMLGHAKSLKSKGNMIHVMALTNSLEGYSEARAGHAIAGLRSIQVAVMGYNFDPEAGEEEEHQLAAALTSVMKHLEDDNELDEVKNSLQTKAAKQLFDKIVALVGKSTAQLTCRIV
jgi:hypothetical protein